MENSRKRPQPDLPEDDGSSWKRQKREIEAEIEVILKVAPSTSTSMSCPISVSSILPSPPPTTSTIRMVVSLQGPLTLIQRARIMQLLSK